jgi:phospholipid/cholesterol/gamma-HCH transport system substrate-binding protein
MARQSALAIRGPLTKSVLFVIGTLLVLTLIAIELGAGGGFRGRTEYKAIFTDTSGLEATDSVRIAGVKVGEVSDVEVVDNVRGMVTFAVDQDTPLPGGVQVAIRYLNLTGDRFLELKNGPGEVRPLAEDAVIPPTQTSPALDLDTLLAGFSPLFEGLAPDQINSLSTEIVSVLQGQGGTIENLLQRVASLTSTLGDRDRLIGDVVNNLNTVLATLDERGPQVSATIRNLDQLVTGLAGQRGRLGEGLDSTRNLVTGVDTLLSRIRGPLDDIVPQIDRLSSNVVEGQAGIDQALRDLPGGYLRVSRLGSRGSTYNLFICSLRVKTTGPTGAPVYSPWFGPNPDLERCQPNVAPLETPEQSRELGR